MVKTVNQSKPVKHITVSVSLSVNDRDRLKALALHNETTSSALLAQWIKEHYRKEFEVQQEN